MALLFVCFISIHSVNRFIPREYDEHLPCVRVTQTQSAQLQCSQRCLAALVHSKLGSLLSWWAFFISQQQTPCQNWVRMSISVLCSQEKLLWLIFVKLVSIFTILMWFLCCFCLSCIICVLSGSSASSLITWALSRGHRRVASAWTWPLTSLSCSSHLVSLYVSFYHLLWRNSAYFTL